jgi:ankyrin repeat protein
VICSAPEDETVNASTNDIDRAVMAARDGDAAWLRQWLASGGGPNAYDEFGWTPLLAAAVRGRLNAVEVLLGNENNPADVLTPHRASGAAPIHFAGHSGSVDVAAALLAARPDQLDAVWELNGHTLLLQAVFYGHLDLADFALKRGASTAATTVRGLAALELARQFDNQRMVPMGWCLSDRRRCRRSP